MPNHETLFRRRARAALLVRALVEYIQPTRLLLHAIQPPEDGREALHLVFALMCQRDVRKQCEVCYGISIANKPLVGGQPSLQLLQAEIAVGVKPLDQDPTTAARLGVQSGALVSEVEPNGPAAGAGMTAPAVITAVDGKAVTSPNTLGPLLHAHVPGETAQISWVDDSGSHSATVQLISGPAV